MESHNWEKSIFSLQTINVREGMEKREHSWTGKRVAGNVNWYVKSINWYSHYGEQYGGSLKKTNNRANIWSNNATPGHISKGNYH